MRRDQRIVTKIPLTELWDNSGTLTGERVRYLNQSNLLELMRTDPIQYVVADCGLKLERIPMEKRFEFWKQVKPQIADCDKIYREQFPNETFYIASEWRGRTGECLVLLEKYH